MLNCAQWSANSSDPPSVATQDVGVNGDNGDDEEVRCEFQREGNHFFLFLNMTRGTQKKVRE